MWFLYLLSWFALAVQVCFVTLSIAAGLYYLAELVEEYTVMSGKIIKYMIWMTTGVYIGFLLFEEISFVLILTGLFTNVIYYFVLRTFPFIELTSAPFLLSIVFIIVNHYLAFSYFSSVWHPFSEVLAYFTVCLWLIPFAFFVSLSANENVLPTLSQEPKPAATETEGDVVSHYFSRKNKRAGLLSFLKNAQDAMLPQRVKKAY